MPIEVEAGERAGRFEGGERLALLPEHLFAVEIGTIAALGDDVVLAVEDMVEDLQALVRHAHLVEIGKDEGAAQIDRLRRLAAVLYSWRGSRPGLVMVGNRWCRSWDGLCHGCSPHDGDADCHR